MTASERVGRTKRVLGLLAGLTALLWAGGVVFGLLLLGTLLSVLFPLSPEVRAAFLPVAILSGAGALAVLLWRRRFVWSAPKVALWIEERAPELRYALVTAIDPRYADLFGDRLAPIIAGVDTGSFLRRAARQSLLPAGLVLLVAGASFAAIPARWKDGAGGTEAPVLGAENEMPNRLDLLRGSVTPPDYALASGIEKEEFDDPTTIAGLVGSVVDVRGEGIPDGVEILLGETPLTPRPEGDGWGFGFTLPDSAVALQLKDRQYRRLVVIAPRADEQPDVQLLLPARDTTVRTVRGDMVLHARMTDDLGLGGAFFESIVATGQGEGHIKFRRDTLRRRRFSKTRSGELKLTLPLASFNLGEGDILSVRAVSFDNNTLTGPGFGTSETRVLRVATSGEYDSLAVEGAPPPSDTLLVTLRYLIQLTEEIDTQEHKIPREQFVDSAVAIGRQLRRIIRTVENIQREWTMDGVFPENPLLKEAHEALWEGARALYIAETGEALPPMWAALRLLQEFALAERYYIRGRPPDLIVNLGRVRMQGSDTGYAAPRTPREMSDERRRVLLDRYVEAVNLLAESPDSSLNTLMLMQVEALREFPTLASFLGEAVAAIRANEDASAPLGEVRRFLEGRAVVRKRLPHWSAIW